MKILYDHQAFAIQKFGGVSRYFYELMNHSKGIFEYDAPCVYSENVYLKPLNLYKEFPVKFYFKGKRIIINFLNKSNSIKKIKKKNYDIIHPTYYDPYILQKVKNIPLVTTIHDMIYEKMPEYFYYNDDIVTKKRKYFVRSSAIIAISHKTKNDLLEIYPEIPEERVKVVYHGEVFHDYQQNTKKQNYILFAGQRGVYKNFKRFVKAVAPLLITHDLQLICTGQEFIKDECMLLSQYKIFEKSKAIFASEIELQNIYAKALIFVFPSLYEGFGFPILEAFASGCPVILSNTSCFPEIAGNAAVYFDPYSADDMREKIEKVILDSSLQSMLIKRGYEQVKKFSWEKCVRETMEVYKSLQG